MILNPVAKAFFEQNPAEPYWYYSANVRVSNPRVKPWLIVPRPAWPAE